MYSVTVSTGKLGRKIDQEKRVKCLRWDKAKVPVKEQAKRLGVSLAAVYAMRNRMSSRGE